MEACFCFMKLMLTTEEVSRNRLRLGQEIIAAAQEKDDDKQNQGRGSVYR